MVEKFEQWGETILRIEELWFADDVPILCGGSIEVMINAAERHQRLDLQRIPGRRRGDWKIELVGGVQRRLMDWSPVQLKSEAEIVTMEDDEPEYGMERSSFDSGVHIGNHDDNTWCSEDTNWSQVGGWADEAHLDWGRQ